MEKTIYSIEHKIFFTGRGLWCPHPVKIPESHGLQYQVVSAGHNGACLTAHCLTHWLIDVQCLKILSRRTPCSQSVIYCKAMEPSQTITVGPLHTPKENVFSSLQLYLRINLLSTHRKPFQVNHLTNSSRQRTPLLFISSALYWTQSPETSAVQQLRPRVAACSRHQEIPNSLSGRWETKVRFNLLGTDAELSGVGLVQHLEVNMKRSKATFSKPVLLHPLSKQEKRTHRQIPQLP